MCSSVEPYENWSKERQNTFARLASILSISLHCPKAKVLAEIYGRLNISLVRSVARAILFRRCAPVSEEYGSPVALFDVRVTDTDAPTHSELFLPFSLQLRKRRKRSTLKQQLFTKHHSHPLLCQSMESRVKKQTFFIKHLAQKLAHKWEKSNSEVLGWMRARLSFAILRATNLCLRSSRTKWRSAFGMDDGAGLPIVAESYGAWGLTARDFFSKLGSRLATSLGKSKSVVTHELYGRMSMNLVRANATTIQSSSVPPPELHLRTTATSFSIITFTAADRIPIAAFCTFTAAARKSTAASAAADCSFYFSASAAFTIRIVAVLFVASFFSTAPTTSIPDSIS
ncbi:hypothetical protein EMCRGX_G018043 [Ephydatia muelleri]